MSLRLKLRRWVEKKRMMDVCGVWPFTLPEDCRFNAYCVIHDDAYEEIRRLFLMKEISLAQAKPMLLKADREFFAGLYGEIVDLPIIFDFAVMWMKQLVKWFGFSVWVSGTRRVACEGRHCAVLLH